MTSAWGTMSSGQNGATVKDGSSTELEGSRHKGNLPWNHAWCSFTSHNSVSILHKAGHIRFKVLYDYEFDTIISIFVITLRYIPQPPAGGGEGAAVVVGEGGGGAVVGPPALGSKHSQAEQYCVLTLSPQQSPPSQPHSSLLFSSSQ